MSSLSAAEQLALLDPNRVKPREAVKTSLLSLVGRGALALETSMKQGWFGSEKTILRIRDAARTNGQHEHELVQAVRYAREGDGASLQALGKECRRRWGDGSKQFTRSLVLPSLVRQGFLREEERKLLLVIKTKAYSHTSAGLMEKQKVEQLIDRARALPLLLKTNPAEARAIVLAAGATLFLVPELARHYPALAALYKNPEGDSGVDGGGGGDSGSSDGESASFDGLSGISIDSLSSFDSSFDSSFSSGDGSGDGGDGGGGDGGGGGGD